MSNLTPNQIAQWFRDQAQQFESIAKTVEQTFKASAVQSQATMALVSPSEIKERLKVSTSRVKSLAAHFSVTPDVIEQAINSPGSGLEIRARGWVYAQEAPQA